MANNALLFNAALKGWMAGQMATGLPSDPTQGDYAAMVTQAVNVATTIDAAIATDTAGVPVPPTTTGISVAGGAAIVPAGSTAVFESQLGKEGIMFGLCFGASYGRFSATGVAGASFAAVTAAIVAAYRQAALSLVVT